ncbi:protein XRP2 [Octopus bimaculoides]|uniref:protein XRP2 n=1 Tax=Octopus bimaculoides TaxID=37653 RepID=UPI0022DF8166|nr:protein XRP2 [Octopus bimaculoides]
MGRMPGTVDGQQFIIEKCEDTNIYIFDHSASVTIDDCINCRIFLGPVKTRHRQHRTHLSLIINGMKLKHFRSAQLSTFNNNWSSIFDFTQVAGMPNLSLLPADIKVEDYIPLPTVEPFNSLEIDTDPLRSVVPVTLGSRERSSEESCLIVFFSDGSSHDRAVRFIEKMKTEHPEVSLLQSSEVEMEKDEVERVFGSLSYQAAAKQGEY